MGNSGDIWVPRLGLGILGLLAITGLAGGLMLANNNHEVPPWLSAAIGSYGSTFGVLVLAIYGRGAVGRHKAGP